LEPYYSKKKITLDYFIIFFVYFFAHFFLLVIDGLFWDDYVWVGNTFQDYFVFSQMLYGLKFPGFVFAFIYMLPPQVSRIIVFFVWLVIGFLLYMILLGESVSRHENIFFVLLFLLMPLNISIYTLCVAPYSFYFFLFAIASFLFFKFYSNYHKKSFLTLRILNLIFFYISFHMNSLLSFYAVPIFYIYILYRRKEVGEKGLLKITWVILKKYPDFISLPFIFFLIKVTSMNFNLIYLDGIYSQIGYNKISLTSMMKSVYLVFYWFVEIFPTIIKRLLWVIHIEISTFLITSISTIFFVVYKNIRKKKKAQEKTQSVYNSKGFVLFGLFSFYFGAMPYISIGLHFDPNGWNSRNLILLSFGVVLFILGLYQFFHYRILKNKFDFSYVMFILIVLLVMFHYHTGKAFFYDNMKQKSIIYHFRNNSIIRNNNVFLINDETKMLNAFRSYNYYEYTGLFYISFNESTRIATDVHLRSELKGIYNSRYILPYKTKDCPKYEPEACIVIKEHDINISSMDFLNLVRYYVFDKKRYYDSIKNFVLIESYML